MVEVEGGLNILWEPDSRIALPSPQVDKAHNPYLASASPRAIPELYDIPIGMVNRVLYHDTHQRAARMVDRD